MAEAYPLYWPQGWKRARNPEKSRFQTGFGAARKLLFDELSRLGAAKVILSTNIPLRNDGMPRANMRPDGGDAGVAVYFQWKSKPMVLACGKFTATCDNIYAIAKTIDAMRGIERWGASDMMERAFSGFKALSAPVPWWELLGVNQDSPREAIEAAYKSKAKAAHPDLGGSHEAMAALNAARAEGLAA